MLIIAVFVTLLSIICRSEADNDHKVGIIEVENGGPIGKWGSWQICPNWGIATGFWIKIHSQEDPPADKTALNGIALKCSTGGYVTSSVGIYGSYGPLHSCPNNKYLKRFKLRVDPYQGTGYDDTAANNIKFKCGYYTSGGLETLPAPEGGDLGDWGSWSDVCPDNSAICGIRTRMHQKLGDATMLNDVQFYCCN